jgi:hypothetical protein
MRRIAATCIVLFASAAHAEIVAGPIVSPVNGHAYYLLSRQTWTTAEAEAASLGGHLATIRSEKENTWVAETFIIGGLIPEPIPVWIGFTDQQSEGDYVWSSGESVGYTRWSPGEPNNAGEEDWAAMGWYFLFNGSDDVGGWIDCGVEGTYFEGPTHGPYYGVAEVVCYVDFNNDGVLDLFDFLSFVNSFNASEARADCTGDGTLDLFDFLCFVNGFEVGC